MEAWMRKISWTQLLTGKRLCFRHFQKGKVSKVFTIRTNRTRLSRLKGWDLRQVKVKAHCRTSCCSKVWTSRAVSSWINLESMLLSWIEALIQVSIWEDMICTRVLARKKCWRVFLQISSKISSQTLISARHYHHQRGASLSSQSIPSLSQEYLTYLAKIGRTSTTQHLRPTQRQTWCKRRFAWMARSSWKTVLLCKHSRPASTTLFPLLTVHLTICKADQEYWRY